MRASVVARVRAANARRRPRELGPGRRHELGANARVGATFPRHGDGARRRANQSTSALSDAVLGAGPLLLPLVLSTSAALYRGAAKAARERGEALGPGVFVDGVRNLPAGMWVGIASVWAYWAAEQLGAFR
jgi:hypothetical protein